MWAIVTRNMSLEIKNVLVVDDSYDQVVERAVLLAADQDLFDRENKEEEIKVEKEFRAHGNFVRGLHEILIIRAFRA